MLFLNPAANWLLLLFLFQISSVWAFYAERGIEPIHQPNNKGANNEQITESVLTDEGQGLDWEALGLSEVPLDKRRLGSALNIGRGKGQKAMTFGKRIRPGEGDFEEGRFFQGRGQEHNNEIKQPSQSYAEKMADEEMMTTSDVDRRNIGSAMNLRKNDNFRRRISPSSEDFEDDAFEEERERRRLGAAMNLKNKAKSRLGRE